MLLAQSWLLNLMLQFVDLVVEFNDHLSMHLLHLAVATLSAACREWVLDVTYLLLQLVVLFDQVLIRLCKVLEFDFAILTLELVEYVLDRYLELAVSLSFLILCLLVDIVACLFFLLPLGSLLLVQIVILKHFLRYLHKTSFQFFELLHEQELQRLNLFLLFTQTAVQCVVLVHQETFFGDELWD